MRLKRALPLLLATLPALAQVSEVPLALNLPTATLLDKGDVGIRFTHRFTEATRGNGKDVYGLDGFAYAALGFDISLPDFYKMNFQAYRSADKKTFVLAMMENVWNGEEVQAALRVERFDEVVKGGILGSAVQLPIDWRLGQSFVISAVPTWLSRSNLKHESMTTVAFGARWEMTPRQSLKAEIYPRPSKLRDVTVGSDTDPHKLEQGWAIGYTFRTPGHRFTILGTNVPGTTTHQVVAGDYGGQGPMRGQWALGLNIVRMF